MQEHPEDTRIVSVDVNTGTMSDLPVGRGVKFNPSMLSGDVVQLPPVFAAWRLGTRLQRLTHSRGNDAHMAWSPDGEEIVFTSTPMGFKDEAIYTDAPQPYGEIFIMRADGSHIRQLTDNQWEEGTPAWQPVRPR